MNVSQKKALRRRLLRAGTAHADLKRLLDPLLPPLQTPGSAAAWEKRARSLRQQVLDLFMAGHPRGVLTETPRVEWRGTIETGAGYRIRKLRYEGYPCMWVPALLYEPTSLRGKIPVVLNPNGHHRGGKAMDYKQSRCINLAKRGMLALNTEFIGMGELTADAEHLRIALLDVLGISGVGVFYLLMKRGLDVLLAHRHADPTRVAMTGLSGGGWQTAILSALDERITTIVPVAGHSPLWQRQGCIEDIGDLEQCPTDLCTIADYDVLTAMFAPRPTRLIYNRNDDCCFQTRRTRRSIYRPAKAVYEKLGVGDRISLYDNTDPGTHNYERDNRRQLYRFLDERFGDSGLGDDDLPFADELKTEDELNVGLPDDQETMLSLAIRRMRAQRSQRARHAKATPAQRRKRLRQLLRMATGGGKARAEAVGKATASVKQWRLHLDTGTLAVTELLPAGRARGVEIVLSDGGRGASGLAAQGALAAGHRVLVVDLFGTGDTHLTWQYHMVAACAGLRPLGLQTGQLLQVINWAQRTFRARQVHLRASGVVMPVVALIAAALAPTSVAAITLGGYLGTLERLIDTPHSYMHAAPLFCFGLLAEFDLPDLLALAPSVPVCDASRGPLQM